LRQCFADPTLAGELARDTGLEIGWIEQLLANGRFGAAWARIEARSERLRRRRVAVCDLPEQMAEAEAILATLRPDRGLASSLEPCEATA
jgi:hypothetical protein